MVGSLLEDIDQRLAVDAAGRQIGVERIDERVLLGIVPEHRLGRGRRQCANPKQRV